MLTRNETALQDRWNLPLLYPSFEEWEGDFASLSSKPDSQTPFEDLLFYENQLAESPAAILAALQLYFGYLRSLEKLLTYAHLKHDEDITEEQAKSSYERVLNLYHDFRQKTAWLEPEILKLPTPTLQAYASSPELLEYQFYIERLQRLKDHTLSSAEETIIALAGTPLSVSYKTFSALNNADLKFPACSDKEGQSHPLSHGLYRLYLHERDRVLRQSAFTQYHKPFADFENTFCELLQGVTQSHLFEAKARKYTSCLQAALTPHNIPEDVYSSLISAVHQRISSLHRYVALKAHVLKLDKLHSFDLYTPLTKNVDIRMSYQQAEEKVIASVAPLGLEYQQALAEGLRSQGWVDRYENKHKRSGAYSSGCYDSHPYILLNFKGLLNDAFTLAHEAGHSMHSWLSRKHQPYHMSDYPIFVAEVASTFNEELLMRLLLSQAANDEERLFLLTQKIEDIYATLFRQTLFAEFEWMIHRFTEQNVPLTPHLLKEEYKKLNARYFGPYFACDDSLAVEWARIPHFYYNFYVYQYATGISAALALSDRVMQGREKDRMAYLQFLQSGSSRYPIDLLATAGVDMRSKQPVLTAIDVFDRLLDEVEALCGL